MNANIPFMKNEFQIDSFEFNLFAFSEEEKLSNFFYIFRTQLVHYHIAFVKIVPLFKILFINCKKRIDAENKLKLKMNLI